ncbi:rifin [Plasmodium reichenowi]|uniref:Rifin n=1 Tax=Plasmodium reichenowi TaxID=5854 RepID=A0A060RQB5_PLARE|nr:rifin [Plasmodium reichenowi]
MKVHYINILLFALPLNILAHNQRNHYITIYTQTNRSLCECDLYIPNYDNDPEMKAVMENFTKQTQQRFHEYDDRMKTTRQKCKDQCDKEIQKIILKDKLEKELTEKLSKLQTDIQSDAIPTCTCQKSLADKTEKFCLKCGYGLGGGVPGLGVLGGYGAYELVQLTKIAAIASAEASGIEAGIQAGITKAIAEIKSRFSASNITTEALGSILNSGNYTNKTLIGGTFKAEYVAKCMGPNADVDSSALCLFNTKGHSWALRAIEQNAEIVVKKAGEETVRVTAEVTPKYIADGIAEVTNASAILSNPVVISFIVIITIVIIILIIYLILRYLRKKKMKKKLQYIKVLKE